MPGKRPRPFLRTSSKLQLMQGSTGYGNSSPPRQVPGTKHALRAPQRIVVGFDVVGTENCSSKLALDACESPRSVLERSALSDSVHLHHHDPMSSPRSPHAVLEGESYHPPKGGIASGIVAASNIKSEELAMEHISPCQISARSNPTTITDHNNVVHTEKVASREMHTPSPPSYHVDVFRDVDVGDDAEEDIQFGDQLPDSIFCAASPFSNCCSLDLQAGDFLSVCFFCKCPLMPCKDIFMYRGDRAFCSAECRYQQIVMDELKERHPAGATYYPVASHDGQSSVL